MKLLRLSLVCSVLLLAATPLFALACKSCDGVEYPYCVFTPGSDTRCQIGVDWCNTISWPGCSPFTDDSVPVAMLAEWTVASIEVSRPAEGTKVVNTPTAVAEADVSPSELQK